MSKRNWTRDELIVAFNLYCKTPFNKIGSKDPGIVQTAEILGRSISAVALKLANFARLDPALKDRKISGMKHGSKGELLIWNEFHGNWEELAWRSEKIVARYKGKSVTDSAKITTKDLPSEGKERLS